MQSRHKADTKPTRRELKATAKPAQKQSKGHQKSIEKSTKNRPKNLPNIHQTSTKINQKSTQKSTKNQSKIDPKSVKNRSKIGSQTDFASRAVSGPILAPFLDQLGPILGAKLGPCWGHVGQKIDFLSFLKPFKNEHDFQLLSGPSWERFLIDFGSQNGAEIGPKSVSRAIMKKIQKCQKNLQFCMFFDVRGC